jgi:hypothetical protein
MSKKEDIITTALNLFNRYNYSSVGVDRIISESGVAKMTFYKYFHLKRLDRRVFVYVVIKVFKSD